MVASPSPFAAVEAFKDVAKDEARAHLVIKVNDATGAGQHPVIAGYAANRAPTLVKYLVGGGTQVPTLLTDDAEGE